MQLLRGWKEKSRYQEVIRVCLPLVLGMSATTTMEFTDRVFLANYSLDAVAAALPAGITAFVFMAFLGGIGGYTSVFIAQYTGRGEQDKVGVVLWQGIYFTLFSGLLFLGIAETLGPVLFEKIGHPPKIRILEEIYFTILCKGAVFHVALNTLSTFFSGRGLTKPVMTVYFVGMIINIPLDYALIFGKFGFPEMGIKGAALATVAAWVVPTIILLTMIFTKKNISRFKLFSSCRFDPQLFYRLLRFGVPGSLQFTIDIIAFTVFTLVVGRLGTIPLAATTVVISINSVAFMPSMGFSQGVSILVGQALGEGDKEKAKAAVWSAVHLVLIYILIIDLCFIFFPEPIFSLFIPEGETGSDYQQLLVLGKNLLMIVAGYLFLDSLYMVFSGALRGAGDNTFIMVAVFIASLTCIILPCYFGVIHFGMGVYFAWFTIMAFVVALFTLSSLRYRQGKWLDMLVIEPKSG